MRVNPDGAAHAIRAAARRFVQGEVGIVEVWNALHANLVDLCRDEPLHGDFLALFQALERWEASTERRSVDLEQVRLVASRLVDH